MGAYVTLDSMNESLLRDNEGVVEVLKKVMVDTVIPRVLMEYEFGLSFEKE